ncbi:ATP-binding protein [Streptomyces cucumeris]|uniref:ATP-binding protein n=1 Tax=Streptomyces cucumeris TaxID=2962890 RepID=UPI003D7176D3
MFVETQQAATTPGFYLRPRPTGFAVHMTACAAHLHDVRVLADKALTETDVSAGTSYTVQWVVSELVGNAVRACGDHVPLVVEIEAEESGVAVRVHDPERDLMPSRRPIALDDDSAQTGRGLGLLDILVPGWHVRPTPVGKQIVCHVPHAEGDDRA